jgi:hypothetical protein
LFGSLAARHLSAPTPSFGRIRWKPRLRTRRYWRVASVENEDHESTDNTDDNPGRASENGKKKQDNPKRLQHVPAENTAALGAENFKDAVNPGEQDERHDGAVGEVPVVTGHSPGMNKGGHGGDACEEASSNSRGFPTMSAAIANPAATTKSADVSRLLGGVKDPSMCTSLSTVSHDSTLRSAQHAIVRMKRSVHLDGRSGAADGSWPVWCPSRVRRGPGLLDPRRAAPYCCLVRRLRTA